MDISTKIQELTAELTRQRLAIESQHSKTREALDALRREFELAMVAPLPRWSDRVEANAGDMASMEDEAFARLRAGVTRERDLVKRVAGQSALVRLVVGAIAEKRNRLKALEERIKNGDAEEAEVKVAQRRKRHVEEGVKVLRKRLWAVTEDFARSRKTLLARVVALTTGVAEVVPKSDDFIKSAFSVEAGNIENSLRLLAEAEAQFKAGSRSKFTGLTGFVGRGK